MWVCMCRTTTSSRLRSFFDSAMPPSCQAAGGPRTRKGRRPRLGEHRTRASGQWAARSVPGTGRWQGGLRSPGEHAHADRGDDRRDPQDDEGRQVTGSQRQDEAHRQALGGLLIASVPPCAQARRRRRQESGR